MRRLSNLHPIQNKRPFYMWKWFEEQMKEKYVCTYTNSTERKTESRSFIVLSAKGHD